MKKVSEYLEGFKKYIYEPVVDTAGLVIVKRGLIAEYDVDGRGECYYCGKEFGEEELKVSFRIPLVLGGGLLKDAAAVLGCEKCNSWKASLDKEVIKFFKELHLIGGGKARTWNNVRIKQLHDYYHQTVRLWFEAEENINGDVKHG